MNPNHACVCVPSEMLELGYVLSVGNENSLCQVVWLHFVIFLEGGRHKSKLGEASVQIEQEGNRDQSQEDHVVPEFAAL